MPPKPVYTIVQLGIPSSHHNSLCFRVLPRPGVVAILLFLALARSGTPYRFLQLRIDHAAGVRAVRALQTQTFVLRSGRGFSSGPVTVVAGLVRAHVVRGEPLLATRRRVPPVLPQRGHHVQVHVQRRRLRESGLVHPSGEVHSILAGLGMLDARVASQRHRATVVRAVTSGVLLLEVVLDPLQVSRIQTVPILAPARTLSKLSVRVPPRLRGGRFLGLVGAPPRHVPVSRSSPSKRGRASVRVLDLQRGEVLLGRGLEQALVFRGERAVTFLGQDGEFGSKESVREAGFLRLLEVAAAALSHGGLVPRLSKVARAETRYPRRVVPERIQARGSVVHALVVRVVVLTTGQIVARHGLVFSIRDLKIDPLRRIVSFHVGRAGVQLAGAATSEQILLLAGFQSVLDVLGASVAPGRVQHPRGTHADEEGFEGRGRSVKRTPPRYSLLQLFVFQFAFQFRVLRRFLRFWIDVVVVARCGDVVVASVPRVRSLGNGADRFAGTSPTERVYLLAHPSTPHSKTRA